MYRESKSHFLTKLTRNNGSRCNNVLWISGAKDQAIKKENGDTEMKD